MSDDLNKVPTPDEQDKALSARESRSLYQRIRVLTHDERAVLDELIAGGDIAKYASKRGTPSKELRKLQAKIPDIMDRLGLTDEHLLDKRLKPLLEANEMKFFQKDGNVTDEREVEANDIRLRALDMAFKLRGSYQDADDLDAKRYGDINVQIVNVGA